jgi:hypothetical protein
MFFGERLSKSTRSENFFSLCCSNGSVKLSEIKPLPDALHALQTSNDATSKFFRKNIRRINSMLAFTSLSANQDHLPPRGPPTFKIHGSVYHRAGSLLPGEGQNPRFMSIYIHDTDNELENRLRYGDETEEWRSIVEPLQEMMSDVNPFVANLKANIEKIRQSDQEFTLVVTADGRPSGEHERRYNVPTASEIAILMPGAGDGSETPGNRDIILQVRDGSLQRIHETHCQYDAMQYVLMFPYADEGWHLRLKLADGVRRMSARQFYAYRLMWRDTSTQNILGAGRLFQQYVVDMYAKISQNRLRFLRENQDQLRADLYQGVEDAVQDNDVENAGKKIILPSSFTGSPRYMKAAYADAMSIVSEFGKPSLFITFTCNPEWPEIKSQLRPGETAADRPDLCARVFQLKLKEFIADVTKKHVFGRCVAHVGVVEYQKRGLPHVHLLLILEDSCAPKTPDDYDKFVSAEIPSENNPELRKLVLKHMIHGPCGPGFPSSPCMNDGTCSKQYPKDYCDATTDADDSYPKYRRKSPRSGGHTASKQIWRNGEPIDFEITNQWVVPYNAYLLLKYNAHINVEICSSVTAVKYLYKYVYKGHDRVMFSIQPQNSEENVPVQQRQIDEITQYLDARYIAPPEAVWRILNFDIQFRKPAVQRLQVHLKDQQIVVFNPDDGADAVQAAQERSKLTTLNKWFELNRSERDNPLSNDSLCGGPPSSELRYVDLPKYYSWRNKSWVRRMRTQVFQTIGRPYSVHPNEGERYYSTSGD